MAQAYCYHRPGMKLAFYTEIYDFNEQHPTVASGEQPKLTHDFVPFTQGETLDLAPGEFDIRGFDVNTPNGNTIGRVLGFLVDNANFEIPFAYVITSENRTVVVPTDQFMFFPDLRIVTLEGGIDALRRAPEAKMDKSDADHAARFWMTYRRDSMA